MSFNIHEINGGTFLLNSGALAVGSTASRVAVGVGANYSYKGVFGLRTVNSNALIPCEPGTGVGATPNAYTDAPAGSQFALLVLIDPQNANAISGAQGPIVGQGDPCPLPPVPNNRVCLGAAKVVTLTNPFIIGTTAFNAAGVTTTFFNFSTPPGGAI